MGCPGALSWLPSACQPSRSVATARELHPAMGPRWPDGSALAAPAAGGAGHGLRVLSDGESRVSSKRLVCACTCIAYRVDPVP